jgi:hypothetical protein
LRINSRILSGPAAITQVIRHQAVGHLAISAVHVRDIPFSDHVGQFAGWRDDDSKGL